MTTENCIAIKNAAQLVTCSGFGFKAGAAMGELGIIENGALIVEDGRIKAVGPSRELADALRRFPGEIIDATGRAVLPGFVDPHTHFVFGGYRAEEFDLRLKGADYQEILAQGGGILNTVTHTRKASRADLVASGLKRLDTMVAFGVTTVEGKSGYGLNLETELKQLEAIQALNQIHPVDVVPTFLGAHAVPQEWRTQPERYVDLVCREMLPRVAESGLAEFCDVFCDRGAFSLKQSARILQSALDVGLKLKIHADEIGALGGAGLAADMGAVSADHLLRASAGDIRKMAEAGVVATLLPATAFVLREPYADAGLIMAAQCPIALATDMNPGSSFTLSIPLLFALATLAMPLSIEEALCALTINAAAAIDRADSIGSLDIGKQGDIIILEFPSYKFLAYHTGVNIVQTVLKKGLRVFERGQKCI